MESKNNHPQNQSSHLDAGQMDAGQNDSPLVYSNEAFEFLLQELKLRKNLRLIDLGAGSGTVTEHVLNSWKDQVSLVVSIEPTPIMLEILKFKFQKNRNVSVVAGAGESIPLSDQWADVIICAQAFHWLDGFRSLKEMHRVLKSKAYLILLWHTHKDDHLSGYYSMDWQKAFEGNPDWSALYGKEFSSEKTRTHLFWCQKIN